jgi:phospholipid/cholesterol/gamma-HCH transport system permease protein
MQAAVSIANRELVLRIPPDGIDPSWLCRPLDDLGIRADAGIDSVRIESSPQWKWDSEDAAFLARIERLFPTSGPGGTLRGLPADLQKLIELATGRLAADPAHVASESRVTRVGLFAAREVRALAAFVKLLGEVVLRAPRFFMGRAQVRARDLLDVLAESGSRALVIVAVVNVLMGAILGFVGALELRTFGAGIYVADLVGIASVRELTPILTAIVLAGRTGASFAARLSTMGGNEEIDALTTLGVSADEFLVLPRVIAMSLLTPVLYVYGCVFAFLGGLCVATPLLNIPVDAYLTETQQAVGAANFVIGALKALAFGALVALIGCYCGLRAERSAAGVGAATTTSVVAAIVTIIAVDAVFAVCANALGV